MIKYKFTGGFKTSCYKGIVSDRYKTRHILYQDDIVVAHTDLTQEVEVIGNPALVQTTDEYEKYIMSMDLIKVIPKENIYKYYIYILLKNKQFKNHCLAYSNGTTVLHLSKKALPTFIFNLPPQHELDAFHAFTSPLFATMQHNSQQIAQLATARDTLLSPLLRGRLAV